MRMQNESYPSTMGHKEVLRKSKVKRKKNCSLAITFSGKDERTHHNKTFPLSTKENLNMLYKWPRIENLINVPNVEKVGEKPKRLSVRDIRTIKSEVLDWGTQGIVRLGFIKPTRPVAVICIPIYGSAKTMEHQQNEYMELIRTMLKRNHENVVRVSHYAIWPGNVAIGIVMEYLPAGNLADIVREEDARKIYGEFTIPSLLGLRFCLDIANGLSFLHTGFPSKRVAHGDIKPDNILLTADLRCKICDFSCSEFATCTAMITSKKEEERCTYSFAYSAPECKKNIKLRHSTAMDIYSFGTIMVEIFTRKSVCLFLDETNNINLQSVSSNISNSQNPSDILTVVQNEMEKCCNFNEDQRPSVEEVQTTFMTCFNEQSHTELDSHVANITRHMDLSTPRPEKYDCAPMNEFVPQTGFTHIWGNYY